MPNATTSLTLLLLSGAIAGGSSALLCQRGSLAAGLGSFPAPTAAPDPMPDPTHIARTPPVWRVRDVRNEPGDRAMGPEAIAALDAHLQPLRLPLEAKGPLHVELRLVRGRIVETAFTRSHASLENMAVLSPLRQRLRMWETDATLSGQYELRLRAAPAEPQEPATSPQ